MFRTLEEDYRQRNCLMERIVAEFIINLGGDRDEKGKFHTGDCDNNEKSKDSDRSCLSRCEHQQCNC